MTDLEALIAAVDAGLSWPADSEQWDTIGVDGMDAADAYNGSLDAALRLHEALLPGWRWVTRNTEQGDVDRGECEEGDSGFANIWEKGSPNYGDEHHYAFASTPARAWLLSILRVLKAKGDA